MSSVGTVPLVLVIEDAEDQRELISELLDKRYEVRSAWNLATGIRAAIEHRPDIVLLDLNLKDCRGLETLAQFIKSVPDPPVIVVTGAIDDMGAEAVRLGANDVLLKPYEQKDLLGVIARAIARKRTWQYRAPIDEAMARLRETISTADTVKEPPKSRPPDSVNIKPVTR